MEKTHRKRFLLYTALNALFSGLVLLVITVIFPNKLWLSLVFFTLAAIGGSMIISKTVVKRSNEDPNTQ